MANKAARTRRRLAAAFLRAHAAPERAIERAMRKFLAGVTREALGRLQAFGTTNVTAADLFDPREHSGRFSRAMLPAWNVAVWTGWQFEAESIATREPSAQTLRQALETPTGEIPFNIRVDPSPRVVGAVRQWLISRQVGVWGRISRTIHGQLRRQIQIGLSEGDSLDDLAKRLQKTLPDYNRNQAKRVARTETTAGMNGGGQVEREDLGIEHKIWVSTLDSRTRNEAFNHLAPDGQVQRNQDPFIVSGQRLLFPGDISLGASAGNVIHCRCSSTAHFPPIKPGPGATRRVVTPTIPEPPI